MSLVQRLVVIAALLPAGGLVAGCGSSSAPAIAPSERVVHAHGSSVGQIVLSASGARRIGIETATARHVPAPRPRRSSPIAIVPLAAVVYDPGGKAYVFTSPGALKYTEVPIQIDHVTGNSVYLRSGPRPGTAVVTVGAEELFGVQAGVLAQT